MTWHGNTLNALQWNDSDSGFPAYTLGAVKDSEADLHIMFNMADAACEAELPIMPGRVWRRALNTSLD